jgi:hypothetical protein
VNTPPPYAPPPSPPPIGRKTWLLVGGILGFLFLVCAGLIAFGANQVRHMAKTDPKPIVGSGKPELLIKGKNGWATYRFPELGLVIDLPEKPVVGKPEWTPEQRLLVRAWAYYEVDSDAMALEIDANEYVLGATLSSEEEAESLVDSFAEIESVSHVEKVQRKQQVGGRDGVFLKVDYELEKEPITLESYHLNDKKRSVNLRFTYHRLLAKGARPEIDRILESARFE